MYALSALLSFTALAVALDVRLYSSDPNRDCTGTTTAVCTGIAYDGCCERGSTPIYRTALCTGLDTVGGGTIPVTCESVTGLQLRGAGVFYISSSKRDLAGLEAIGDQRCTNHVEPDVLQIDGKSFTVSAKHGVPDEVTERFWEMVTNTPDMKHTDIPADLMAYENATILAPLSSEELRKASARTLIVRDLEETASLVKRQGLPGACAAN
ncbi:hypothetical protein LTR56_027410 [Elasticomyces elasticus]|nr:hypothetical protein LTR56_027410 [Elasticomyces elasticus]KAK3619850.1 hypothetical protein LTR22_025823 [Elasticomyces elasticus]KAK4897267.1 hypothetical protein LTR49_028006 [Elasticomyces elasticus]KAK5734713.1 hypothetical protein LTS12_026637 [Elasticomyces elasticus]